MFLSSFDTKSTNIHSHFFCETFQTYGNLFKFRSFGCNLPHICNHEAYRCQINREPSLKNVLISWNRSMVPSFDVDLFFCGGGHCFIFSSPPPPSMSMLIKIWLSRKGEIQANKTRSWPSFPLRLSGPCSTEGTLLDLRIPRRLSLNEDEGLCLQSAMSSTQKILSLSLHSYPESGSLNIVVAIT